MKLSQNNKVNLIAAVGVVILTVILNFMIFEWHKADVRYEEGQFYNSSNYSITSLKLKNYGHTDAEKITINAIFQENIQDVYVSDQGTKLSIISGGVNKKDIVFIFERIVPDEQVYLYFSINPLTDKIIPENQRFIKYIKYSGGYAKEGLPTYYTFFSSNLASILFNIIALLLSIFLMYNWIRYNREFPAYNKRSIKLEEDSATLVEATKFIDAQLRIFDKESIKIPDELIELQNKIKLTLYGRKSDEQNKI